MATASINSATATESDALYEVIDGERVEIAPMAAYETLIASLLDRQLQCYVASKGHGWVVVEMLFDFARMIGKKRRPDLAFVSYTRWPLDKRVMRTEAWDVVPNLAVEVVSPTNPADEVVDKIADYFRVGVERVRVLYPSQRQMYVYASPTDVKVLSQDEELIDEALLPGFRLSLSTLFGDTAADK